jgi:hypothetical protein
MSATAALLIIVIFILIFNDVYGNGGNQLGSST